MSTKSSTSNISVTATQEDPASVVVNDPITGTPFLLLDPKYDIHKPKKVALKMEAPASFAAAVAAIAGDNKLVELHEDGTFSYMDNLGDRNINTVNFKLTTHPSAGVLCLRDGLVFDQRALMQWKDQWPGTLLPDTENPEADFEDLSHYKAQGVKDIDIQYTETSIRVNVERDDAAGGTRVPRFWKATSPLFEDHPAHTVMLQLEVETPEADRDGKVTGKLLFRFKLWTPAASVVKSAAMDEAAAQMGKLLEGYTVVRGSIGGGNGNA